MLREFDLFLKTGLDPHVTSGLTMLTWPLFPRSPDRRDRHALRGPEGRRTGKADGVNRPYAAPLRRDRSAEAVASHRSRISPVHGYRHRALAAGALPAAARLLPGRGAGVPGPSRLLAAGGHRAPSGATAGANRIAAAIVPTARDACGQLMCGGDGLRRRVLGRDRGDNHVGDPGGEILYA